MTDALLLIDLQPDFMPGGSLAVRDGDAVVAVARALMPRFPLIVATQDWHPADHASFAVNHPGRAAYEVIDLDGLAQVLWPAHCVAGTAGAALHPGIDHDAIAHVARKGTNPRIDSYSGFFDNGRRQATDLHAFLQGAGVTSLTVMGLATDYCVAATAADALSLGYAVRIVADGCRAVDLKPGDGAAALERLRAAGATITDSAAILAEGEPTPVLFWPSTGEFGSFSNFAAYPITVDGERWPTTEHYFQAMKFHDPAYRARIRTARTPMIAARLGRSRAHPLRADWESMKESVMAKALAAKFTQHPALAAKLLATGHRPIIEDSPKDAYWGRGRDWRGRNRLGKLLEDLRRTLRGGSAAAGAANPPLNDDKNHPHRPVPNPGASPDH